ncbi:MAG: DUF4239 domain-containing protein [Pseudomonadota bacterium]
MFRRYFTPVAMGLLAAALYWFLNITNLNQLPIEMSEYYGEQFFAVLATLYAIITALVLVKGLESFTSLDNAVHTEAMKLRSINAYLFYFRNDDGGADDAINRIKTLLIAYASNVLAQRTADRVAANDGIIDDCVRATASIPVRDENDRVAITEIMRGFDALRTLRANRVNISQERIPPYMIVMLASMSVTIILPFYLHNVPGLSFNIYAIFVLATFGSFIFFLLGDINRPYEGLWTINLSPFDAARVEIAASYTDAAMASVDGKLAAHALPTYSANAPPESMAPTSPSTT